MNVPWLYPLLMLAAMTVCAIGLRRFQRRLPLTGRQKLAIGVGGFIGAMLGAKLPFALEAGWLNEPWNVAAWFAHGKTIMTGLAGGYLGVEAAKWLLDIRVKTGDTFAIPVAVAVAIGRLACFEAGCCYGTPTALPWGVRFPLADLDATSQTRHPTQLYECVFHLGAAVGLWVLLRRGCFRGQLVKLYLIGYSIYRFGSEWLRPEPDWLGGLTAYQWAAMALAATMGVLFWCDNHAVNGSSGVDAPPSDAV